MTPSEHARSLPRQHELGVMAIRDRLRASNCPPDNVLMVSCTRALRRYAMIRGMLWGTGGICAALAIEAAWIGMWGLALAAAWVTVNTAAMLSERLPAVILGNREVCTGLFDTNHFNDEACKSALRKRFGLPDDAEWT